MTQGWHPRQVEKLASIPPAACPSEEHVRALAAAGKLDVRLFKKFVQRPLMSVWEGEDKTGQRILLTVADACGTPAERARVVSASKALLPLAGAPGVRHVLDVLEGSDAFIADFHGAGTAADLVVLRWSPLRRLEFVGRVCDALVALHAAGIVHGCLCPDNILMSDDLYPVLTEVGMVSIFVSFGGDAENFFGYGAYAASEAASGAPDVLSDIYSIGRLLSFVMLDKSPGDPLDFTDIEAKSPDVAAIVRRCCGSRSQRYASMGEVSAELERCRQKLPLATAESATRPPPALTMRPSPEKPAAARTAWVKDEAAPRTGAPWWVAAASSSVLVGCLGVGQILVVPGGAVHLLLETLVAAAAVGVSAWLRTTMLARVVLSLVVFFVTVGIDPVERFSRAESADVDSRDMAARTLVQRGGKNLRGKRFQGADFSRLDLRGADLGSADLTAASFEGARLNEANVEGTSLIHANLAGADLTGVHLERAYGVETALCDAATVLPPRWLCGPQDKIRRSL